MARVESMLYKSNKQKLKAEQRSCYICNSTEDLEVHHFICPYVKRQEVNFEKMKEVSEHIDLYGYAKEMQSIPITSVDDIRNLVLLCQGHHKRRDNGIHNIPLADWLMLKVKEDIKNED